MGDIDGAHTPRGTDTGSRGGGELLPTGRHMQPEKGRRQLKSEQVAGRISLGQYPKHNRTR